MGPDASAVRALSVVRELAGPPVARRSDSWRSGTLWMATQSGPSPLARLPAPMWSGWPSDASSSGLSLVPSPALAAWLQVWESTTLHDVWGKRGAPAPGPVVCWMAASPSDRWPASWRSVAALPQGLVSASLPDAWEKRTPPALRSLACWMAASPFDWWLASQQSVAALPVSGSRAGWTVASPSDSRSNPPAPISQGPIRWVSASGCGRWKILVSC